VDKLTAIEYMVLEAIPCGHQNAIKKVALARRVGIPVRRVRDIIEHMVCDLGVPIGSSTDRVRGGYFIIQNEHDLEVATRHLKPRAVAIFRRLRALERIAEKQFGRQMSLLDELTG